MGIRELSKKGEGLIETGRELENRAEQLQTEIYSQTECLMRAYDALWAASEVDEDGRPMGDPQAARAQIEIIRQRISRAELEQKECRDKIKEVNEQKKEVISDIDRINSAEQSNVEKLKLLQSRMMSKNAALILADIISRMNQGEETKDRLLSSLGQGGSGQRYSASYAGGVGTDIGVSREDNTAVYNEACSRAASNLSESEKTTVGNYTGTTYTSINNYIEGKGTYSTAREAILKRQVTELDHAVSINAFSKDMRLFRGVDDIGAVLGMDVDGKSINELKKSLTGEKYFNRRFMSSSTSPEVAGKYADSDKGGMFVIDIPKGFPALAVGALKSFGSAETEAILGRETEWKIVDVTENQRGQPMIHLTPIASMKAQSANHYKWTPPAIEYVNAVEPVADIQPLSKTRQSIRIVEGEGGIKEQVFDTPEKLKDLLPFNQGNNEYGKRDTCSMANAGVWAQLAGSRNGENSLVGYASTHKDREGLPLCNPKGEVFPYNIPFIWERLGIPCYQTASRNLENIAAAVETGHAVSTSVNAGILWSADNIEGYKLDSPDCNCFGDGGANHQIGIVSVVRNPLSGIITHFYINDTGRGLPRDACRKISVYDFLNAANVSRNVTTISKAPVW